MGALGLLLLTACGGGSGTSGDSGRLSLYVTDAPVHSVDQVWVAFDAIELKPASGPAVRYELDPPVQEDLLALQGENSAALIEDVELEAGQYNWIRLFVVSDELDGPDLEASRVVEKSGGEFRLFVPGNQPPSRNPNQRFVQLSSPFVVPVNGEASFTIDVDLQQALVKKNIPAYPEPFYMLRPSLRIVDNSVIGTIYGDVSPTLVCIDGMGAVTGNAVYVYQGFGVTPGDVYLNTNGEIPRDGIAHPITTANVKQDPDDGSYQYTVGFLAAGDYTVAFTCDAAADEPESDDFDKVMFLQQHEVTVEAGDRVPQDFDDPPLD
jgi:hypothetical protein